MTRRLEIDSEWWAEWSDGSWARWDGSTMRWIPVEGPPPVERSMLQPTPLEANRVATHDTGSVSWLTRAFPPYSPARLALFLGWSAVIIIVVAFLRRAQGFPVPIAVTSITIATSWTALGVAWWSAARSRSQGAHPGPKASPSLARDLIQSAPIAVIGMVVTLVGMLGEEALSPSAVGTAIAFGVAFALLIVLRNSVWMPVIVSIGGGFVLAAAQVVVSVMTFSEPWNFALVWAASSVVLLLLFVPASYAARWLGKFRPPPRPSPISTLPAWAITAMGIVPVSLLALVAGAGT